MKKVSFNKTITLASPLAGITVEDFGEPPVKYAVAKQWEQDAYAKGRAEAEEFAQRQIVEMRNEFLSIQETLFKQINGQFDQLTEIMATRIPGLALALVRRLWGGLELTPESVKKNLEEILSELSPDGDKLIIALHPEDLALLKKVEEDVASHFENLEFKEDERLQRGDCVVQSRFGMIDARIETKLKKIEEEMGET